VVENITAKPNRGWKKSRGEEERKKMRRRMRIRHHNATSVFLCCSRVLSIFLAQTESPSKFSKLYIILISLAVFIWLPKEDLPPPREREEEEEEVS
jgi:hypothetical protein